MAKLLPLESVPGLARASVDDPLFRGWLERIARTTEQQSRLLRRVPTGTAHPQAEASGLVVNISVTGARVWSADEIWLKDADGNPEVFTDQSHTFTLTSDLDTGVAMSISTWYYIWAVWDGTTVRTLVSASATDPTMPAGYTHKGLLSAVRSDGAGAPVVMFTQGKRTEIDEVEVLAAGSATAFTAVSLATAAPPIGRFVLGYVEVLKTVAGVRFSQISLDGVRGTQRFQDNVSSTLSIASMFYTAYADSQIFYAGLDADTRTDIVINGWEF